MELFGFKAELAISNERINNRIKELKSELNKEYLDKSVIILVILNGSFMFASDLLKDVEFENIISFVKLSSYDGFNSSGNVKNLIGLTENIEDKNVLIIEDIVDSGKTISEIINFVKTKNPKSVNIATLLYKPEKYKEKIDIKFIGFEVKDDFVVGYGMDYNGKGRCLSQIYKLI